MSKSGLPIPLLANPPWLAPSGETQDRGKAGNGWGCWDTVASREPGKLGRDRFLEGEEVRKDEVKETDNLETGDRSMWERCGSGI